MQELLENIDGSVDDRLKGAIELVESYIGVEGFDWVSELLDEIDDVVYIEGIAEEIQEQIEFTDLVEAPFTEEDALNHKLTYITLLDIAKEKGEGTGSVKKVFLGEEEDDDLEEEY